MEFFKRRTKINFMGKAPVAAVLSGLLLIASLTSFAVRGLNLGIDFTGGVLVEVGYTDTADLGAIRQQLAASGYPEVQVQNFGTSKDVLIRLPPRDEGKDSKAGGKIGQQILEVLRGSGAKVDLRRVEFVGPQVGKDLTEQGTLAVLFALAMILIYIMIRFQWKFAVGAIVAPLGRP